MSDQPAVTSSRADEVHVYQKLTTENVEEAAPLEAFTSEFTEEFE